MILKAKKKTTAKPIPLTPVAFYDPARDGVTNSLLGTFLTCREKCRLFLEGWSGERWTFALAFGTVTHRVLRAAYDRHILETTHRRDWRPDREWVSDTLDDIRDAWLSENPHASVKALQIMEEVMMKGDPLLSAYFDYWAKDDFRDTNWIEVEQAFRFPWTVTTRKGVKLTTFLRGRIDAAYVVPKSKWPEAPRLLETKTRAVVDENNIIDTLPHNRQSNIYLTALRQKTGMRPASVVLNVIRKPQIRQKKGESAGQFEVRLREDVKTRPDWYFLRMEMKVQPGDMERSEKELNDLVSDFLMWWAGESGHYKNDAACVQPGYGRCEYLKVCAFNDYAELEKRPAVFRELEDE